MHFNLLLPFGFFLSSFTSVASAQNSTLPSSLSQASSTTPPSSQKPDPTANTASLVTITPDGSLYTPPQMSASSVFASLATATPQQTSGEGGGPGESTAPGGTGNAAGASGTDTSGFNISKGGMIAIIVVVTLVVIFGITSSVLFYLAKKRSWEVRATIRKSVKRVATALTPRRSEFPSSVKDGSKNSRNMSRIDSVPPTPKVRGFDLEKGEGKISSYEMKQPDKPSSKWGRKMDG